VEGKDHDRFLKASPRSFQEVCFDSYSPDAIASVLRGFAMPIRPHFAISKIIFFELIGMFETGKLELHG
jgi:hypothetical protein